MNLGHSAVLQGCTVEDEAFIGMGSTLLDGVYVEKHAMVAAGALVRQNTRIPCGEVCMNMFFFREGSVLCSDTSLKLKLNSFRYYYFLQLSMEVVIEHSFIPMSDSIGPIYIH
jgi:carbonic anhydrase/acetyltransferase-like protein (isoleucine patch superfamily)